MNFQPTVEQRNMVEQLAGMVIPDSDICRLILHEGEPIGEGTLKNHFRKELSQGRAKIRVRHHMALMKAIDDGNVTAMIWWDKTRHGIREKVGIDLPAPPPPKEGEPTPSNLTLDHARRIAYVLTLGAIAEKDEPKQS